MNKGQDNNKFLRIGALFWVLFLFTKNILNVPEVVSGFLIGISIAGYIVGIYGVHHDASKLKEWKKSLFKRLCR